MKYHVKSEIKLPEGIKVSYQNNVLSVEGKTGKLERNAILPGISLRTENNKLIIEAVNGSKREKTMIHTYKAHIKNMIKGLSEGHEYLLKICSGHFPMSVAMKGHTLEVKNFLGEKVPRTMDVPKEVSLTIDGENITVKGVDKEKVGKVAGRIELMMRRPGFDKRVFQDGIYITHKDGKAL